MDHFELQAYSLSTYEKVLEHEVKGEYIKMNLIEQNQEGNIIAICYQDNGVFYICTADLKSKNIKTIKITDILHTDNKSKPLSGFWEPLITCAFIPSD